MSQICGPWFESTNCDCGVMKQTQFHIVNDCPGNLVVGLNRLAEGDIEGLNSLNLKLIVFTTRPRARDFFIPS